MESGGRLASGSDRVGTSTTISPVTPSACRLVAVVEDEEAALAGQVVSETGHRRSGRPVLQAKRCECGLRHKRRVLHSSKLDEPGPVWVHARRLACGAQRELRLADPAGTSERQQTACREHPGEVGDLVASPHETRQFDWQVAGVQGGSGGRHGQRSLVLCGPRGKAEGRSSGHGRRRQACAEFDKSVSLSVLPRMAARSRRANVSLTDGPDLRQPIGRKEDQHAGSRDHRNRRRI